MPTHPLVTRAKAGIFKPLECMNCHVTTTSPLPYSYVHALRDPNWKEAMLNEYNALITNRTWVLVSRPTNVNVVRSMWIFKHKFNAYGSLSSGSLLPFITSVDTELKLGSDGDPISDPTLYRSLAGALQYLTFTRPDLSYTVQQLHVSSTTHLSAYTDVDWAGCPVTRQSTSRYCVFLGDNLLSWSAKRQVTLSRSSAEAEYRGVANVVAETAWIRNLLCELHTPLFIATLVYCDNVSVVYMSANPVQHQRTKHIENDIHFVRDFVVSGQVHVLHALRD
nr:putative reverse transcriptase, RNA-dependent DNA polymerase [Tanacetum cinerariifolium]